MDTKQSPTHIAPVVQRLDNAIHRINHYPADSVVCFVNTYLLDSVIQPLSNRGQCSLSFFCGRGAN